MEKYFSTLSDPYSRSPVVKSSITTPFSDNQITSTRRTSSSGTRSCFAQNGSNIIKEDSKKKINYSPKEAYPSTLFTSIFSERQRYTEKPLKGIVGLQNLGNTCYMNSILQCLSRLPPFREPFLILSKEQLNRYSKLEGKLALAFKSFIQELKSASNNTVLNPYEIKSLMGKFSKQFSRSDQQDSAEFFRYFLEAINDDLNRVLRKPPYIEMTGNTSENLREVLNRWWEYSLSRENSLVTDCFQGQQVSVINCGRCGFGSVSCDAFLSLNLPAPERTYRSVELDECLDLHFSGSSLNSYLCTKCKVAGHCKQKVSLYRFPKILVLQLKRFQATSISRTRLDTDIGLRSSLDLSKYKHEIASEPPIYVLKAISHHIGSLYFGHYISECKEDNVWYCFDDSRTHQVPTPTSSTSAYLLFYLASCN